VGWFHGSSGTEHLDTQTASGLVEVDFVGAGSLLVHRAVFEEMAAAYPGPQPWFQEVERDGRVLTVRTGNFADVL
jgi:hypothetical protein